MRAAIVTSAKILFIRVGYIQIIDIIANIKQLIIIDNCGIPNIFIILMWSQVEAKRNKFVNQIRRRQHEQFFQMHRQYNASQLPASAYLPILIKNQQYEDIQTILDCIQIEDINQQLDPKTISIIKQRCQHHNNSKVRCLMFKLLNRIKLWDFDHMKRAIQYLENGQEDMIKQLALYINMKRVQVCNDNQSAIVEETKQKKIGIEEFRTQQMVIFKAIINIKITNPQYRLFWLDIVSQSFQYSLKNENLYSHIKDIQIFFFTLSSDLPKQSPQNLRQQQLTQIIHILHKICNEKSYHQSIVKMQCFHSITQFIFNGTIQILIQGLEIYAELMSQNDALIDQLVLRFNILKTLDKYINHVMLTVQIRVLWALSNILASEHYYVIFQQKGLIEKLFKKTDGQIRSQLRIQLYCCILNLLCNCDCAHLEQLCKNTNTIQIAIDALQWSTQQCMKIILLERVIFAIYHLISEFPRSWILLEQFGVTKYVTTLYQAEKETNKLKMINSLLQLMDKVKKQQN